MGISRKHVLVRLEEVCGSEASPPGSNTALNSVMVAFQASSMRFHVELYNELCTVQEEIDICVARLMFAELMTFAQKVLQCPK